MGLPRIPSKITTSLFSCQRTAFENPCYCNALQLLRGPLKKHVRLGFADHFHAINGPS